MWLISLFIPCALLQSDRDSRLRHEVGNRIIVKPSTFKSEAVTRVNDTSIVHDNIMHHNKTANGLTCPHHQSEAAVWTRLHPLLAHGHRCHHPAAGRGAQLEGCHLKMKITASNETLFTIWNDIYLSLWMYKKKRCFNHVLHLLCESKRCWKLCLVGPSPAGLKASQEHPASIVFFACRPLNHLEKQGRNVSKKFSFVQLRKLNSAAIVLSWVEPVWLAPAMLSDETRLALANICSTELGDSVVHCFLGPASALSQQLLGKSPPRSTNLEPLD